MPRYQPAAQVEGVLRSKGTEVMAGVMDEWGKAFVKFHPQARLDIESQGSATAVPALIAGTADLGPMSRAIADPELANFQKKFEFDPTTVMSAFDCETAFVHKDNPAPGLTLLQLDGIFSKDRRSGHPEVANWGEVGVADAEWANRSVKAYMRPDAASTFKERVLQNGEFKDSAADPGEGPARFVGRPSQAIAVRDDPEGVQPAPLAYQAAGIRAVPLSEDGTGPYFEASYANGLSGKYPLSVKLTISVVKKPAEPLPPLVREFLLFVLSREGQEIAAKAGFGTLPGPVLLGERKKFE
jgi:phosphate transport system substrate-binding protein